MFAPSDATGCLKLSKLAGLGSSGFLFTTMCVCVCFIPRSATTFHSQYSNASVCVVAASFLRLEHQAAGSLPLADMGLELSRTRSYDL